MKSIKKLVLISLLGIAAGAGFGCSTGETGTSGLSGTGGQPGAQGPTGPDGAPGTAGTPGADYGYPVQGSIADANGPAQAGVPVVFYRLDPDGEPLNVLGAGVTDATGQFQIRVGEITAPDSTVELQATLADGTPMRAILAGAQQNVGPVENAVDAVIHDIVAPKGGRAPADFTPDEVAQLTTQASTAVQTAGTDLHDATAVKATVVSQLGGAFAQAAGGSVAFPSAPTFTDPPGNLTPAGCCWIQMSGPNNYPYGIGTDGQLWDGNSDYGQILRINGNALGGQQTMSYEDEHQLVIGPVANVAGTGLDLSRKIYVSPDSNFVRYAEVLTNSTAADVTASFSLESDFDYPGVLGTANGDRVVDPTDSWVAVGSQGAPSVAVLDPGAQLSYSASTEVADLGSITVPAGGTVTLLHWELVSASGGDGLLGQIEGIGKYPPPELFAGLTNAEIAAANVPTYANVVGGAGSVGPLAQVTVTNLTSSAQDVVYAAPDGSFRANVAMTSGDQLQIAATEGTATVTVAAP